MAGAFVQIGDGYTASGAGSGTVATGTGGTSGLSAVTSGNILDVLFCTESGAQYSMSVAPSGTATFGTPVQVDHFEDFSTTIQTLGTLVGGTLYTNGTYTNVPATGGSGTGAIFSSVTVSGGVVTAATIKPICGSGYVATSDTLSASAANLGGTGSGFTYTVGTVGGNSRQMTRWAIPITGSGTCIVTGTYGQTFQTPLIAAVELSGVTATGVVCAHSIATAVATSSTISTPNMTPPGGTSFLTSYGWNEANSAAPGLGGGATLNANTQWKGPSSGGTTSTLAYQSLGLASSSAVPATMTSVANYANTYVIGAIWALTGGGSFSLAAANGAFSMTGQAATLAQAGSTYTLAAAAGSFAVSGQPATLSFGSGAYQLLAAPGAFFVTGGTSNSAYQIDAVAGAFAMSGQAATFSQGTNSYSLAANAGAFFFNGQSASLTGPNTGGGSGGLASGSGLSSGHGLSSTTHGLSFGSGLI